MTSDNPWGDLGPISSEWVPDNQQERLESIRFENPQRPYARRSRNRVMIWSDLHGDMQSTAEMSVPLPLETEQE